MNQSIGMKRKARVLSALLVLSLVLLVPASLAETWGTTRNPNGGSYVNVRALPSYDADVMAELSVGTTVQITGSTGTWYSVWVNGLVGYIHSNFVTVQGTPEPTPEPSGDTATVRSGPLNVREAPSMRARVITQLPTGARVTVLQNEGTWSQIVSAPAVGYVVTSYLTFDGGGSTPQPTPPITTPNANATIRTLHGGNLNLREYASSYAPVLGSFASGSRVRVLTRGESWSRVQAGDQYGYMSTAYLVLDNSGGGTTPGAGYDAVVNNPGSGQVLNLREEPSLNSTSLGQYRNGQYVRVLGVGTDWHRVQVDGKTGYMMSKYVRITSSNATPHKTVTGGSNGFVNLRSGPGYEYGVLRRITNGSAASVVIPYPVWSEVLVRQGSGYQSGYILNSFLK